MENTLENKAKFFAQYWGQKLLKKDIEGLEKFITEPDGFMRSPSEETYLELTPLSLITDEDAIELIKLRFIQNGGVVEDLTDFEENILLSEATKTNYIFVDYLRSKGYALPWMGLSVEQQIKYGWIKLK